MRDKLARVEGSRASFVASFGRFGTKNGYQGRQVKTILLTDVKDTAGNDICDHIWFTLTKGFEALNLQPGERVAFDGRVKPYWKGYEGDDQMQERDYKLSHPTHIRRYVRSIDIKDLPLFK